MKVGSALVAWLLIVMSGPALAQTTPEKPGAPAPTAAPPDAGVYIISPRAGARVTSPVTVQFGLRNMGVTQAGSGAKSAGHHHLLIDANEAIVPGDPLPADKNHLHYGGGQTETRLDLPNGSHTLQLVLGDALHRPFAPSVQSPKIQITVVSPQALRRKRHVRKKHRA
ncbi:DUF4399 domain-containing protein [Methylobacterium mesophilicum]